MYKKWTESDIRELLNELDKKSGYNSSDIPIILSKRFTKCQGQVRYLTYLGVTTVVHFKFNFNTFDGMIPEELAKEIITHEYVHFFCIQKYKKSCKHNHLFKKHCIEFNIPPKSTISMNQYIDPQKSNHKYTVKCESEDCGIVSYRQRVKNVDYFKRWYRCSKCRSTLDIVQNY